MPQPALPEVPGVGARQVAGATAGGALAGPILPRRVYSSAVTGSPGSSESKTALQPPIPCSFRNSAHDCSRSSTSGSIHRLPRCAPHLGPEPASASAPALRGSRRRISPDGSRWIASAKTSSCRARVEPTVPQEVSEGPASRVPPR